MAQLIHTSGPGAPRSVDLEPGLHPIGRSRDCRLVLQGDRVSRVHALIEVGPQGVVLIDRSLNGTWVNDQRTECTPLSEGDRIRIGQNELVIAGLAASAPAGARARSASAGVSSSELLAARPQAAPGTLTMDGGEPTPVVATVTLGAFEPMSIQFRLSVSLADGGQKWIEVGAAPVRIGSQPDSEIHCEGPLASEARIERQGSVLVLEARGDAPGLLVNGAPASRRVIMPGDVVSVGGCRITVELLR